MRPGTQAILYCGFLLAGLLAGCSAAVSFREPASPTLTLSPSPSQAARPSQAMPSPAVLPTATAQPAPARLSPTRPLTVPSPGEIASPVPAQELLSSYDPVQIWAPAAGSQVTAPLLLAAGFQPGQAGRLIRIELRAADDQLLVRKLLERDQLPLPGLLQDQIQFEIPADSLDGWLIVRLEDSPTVPLAVNSTQIKLLSNGLATLNQPAWQTKAIDIQKPPAEIELTGGQVEVAGSTRLDPGQPLKVQIIDMNGRVLGQRLAQVDAQSSTEFKPFISQVSYSVRQPTPGWIIVFQGHPQNGEILHLASLAVILNP